MKAFHLLIVVLIGASAAHGSMGLSDSTAARISVQTTGGDAFVVIDSSISGPTPFTVDSLRPGMHTIRLLSFPVTRWADIPKLDTVSLLNGEHRTLTYDIAARLRISSIPSGARVFLEDVLAGVTPLFMPVRELQEHDMLALHAQGYEDVTLRLDTVRADVLVSMKRSWSPTEPLTQTPVLTQIGNRPAFHLYGPAIASIVAGSVAAYFKFRADDVNNQYLVTGDPVLLKQVRHYDSISAIALVFAEAGMALLSYFLLVP